MQITKEMLESRRERLYASLLQIQGALDVVLELLEVEESEDGDDSGTDVEE